MVSAHVRATRCGRSEVVSDPVISVRGPRKRYGTHEAVKGIDLEVGAGEIFGMHRRQLRGSTPFVDAG
jgi:ABC-2 type transport system ATP-binding protein